MVESEVTYYLCSKCRKYATLILTDEEFKREAMKRPIPTGWKWVPITLNSRKGFNLYCDTCSAYKKDG
jgi:hypothetical protein